MTAYATKTSLTKLLRFKEYDIPSSRMDVAFIHIRYRNSYVLRWKDGQGVPHWADWAIFAGQPQLLVDNEPIPITTEEAESYGLIRQ